MFCLLLNTQVIFSPRYLYLIMFENVQHDFTRCLPDVFELSVCNLQPLKQRKLNNDKF